MIIWFKPIRNANLLDKLSEHLKLSWITQQEELNIATSNEQVSKEADVEIPDHALIRELKAYAEMGYRKGVVQTLEQILEAKVVSSEVYEVMKSLSDSFQFEQLAARIENKK